MAVREGFEPSLRFPVNTLSKRAPSTTRPPHPKGPARVSAAQTPFAGTRALAHRPWRDKAGGLGSGSTGDLDQLAVGITQEGLFAAAVGEGRAAVAYACPTEASEGGVEIV